ncbi:non-canonical purine NTP pyrophosphatase, RdgB/HAM1 family [Candidatus Gottesmanbacteria bacterium RBG_13_37_7]|uniref:dITP/XTP pyrophosphatase n=1 Tax=Candidatus Gottesmanbacteria bacterium RBG_13_37_7 TaxID=1798369 RepID=A0A1F5YII5_9BACT|nr:MAG: non-canonical purine NTP pyrophosphatase, RdgB/HAM1 family [Candidatus Gottesmanbacteria bacterium RBG_13_37_7]
MKKSLVIASANQGKIKEIKKILKDIPFEMKSLIDLKIAIEVIESGKTFEENAVLKAKTVGEKIKLLTLAEDSGLEVDALGGKPGIYSARYTGGSDQDRVEKLLKELKAIPREKRTARFYACVCIYNPTEEALSIFRGISKGYITEEPYGVNGFGYDPVFYNPKLGMTNAQAALKEKNRVSHRAQALGKARKYLLNHKYS